MNSRRHVAPAVRVPIRHTPRQRSHKGRRTVALVVLTLLTFAVSGTAFAVLDLQGNIKSKDIDGILGTSRPTIRATAAKDPDPTDPFGGKPLNIVLIGSDTRDENNAGFSDDGTEGMRSDTTILMHVSANRDRVDLVSIPRDTMLQMPVCTRTDGTTTGSGLIQFNAAYSYGGENGDVPSAAACTIKTIELNANLHIDGFLVVDFAGFTKVIDAIKGVKICIPELIDAPKADNLHLEAGMQKLNGKTALKYARARTGVGLGDGSDLTRIKRQQKLLGAVARQVLSSDTLTDVGKLHGVLQAVTKSLTTSPEMGNLIDLSGMAFSMRNLNPKYISFLTVPIQAYAPDPNRVELTPGVAQEVFDSLAEDRPIKGTAAWRAVHRTKAKVSANPSSTDPTASTPATTEPSTADPSVDASPTDDAASNPFDAISGGKDDDVCS